MALRPCAADIIGKIITPTFTETTSRTFIFNPWEDQPGFIAVYIGKNQKPLLRALTLITNYTPAPKPRRDPYLVTTVTDGPDAPWQIFKGGCGCGSPIKRTHIRMALDDFASSPLFPAQPEPVGG